MRLRTIFFIFLSFCFFNSTAQVSKKAFNKADKFNIVFSADGRMLTFPPVVCKPSDSVCFQVAATTSFIRKQLSEMYTRLDKMAEFFSNSANFQMYKCYYNSGFDLNAYLDQTRQILNAFQTLDSCKGDSIKAFKALFVDSKYIPIRAFLENIFERQFELQIINNALPTTIVPFRAARFSCEDSCIYFRSDKCYSLSQLACEGCGQNADSVRFRLVKTDPFTKTLKDWFEKVNDSLSNLDLKKITQGLTELSKNTSSPEERADMLRSALPRLDKLKFIFPLWFWYSGGKLVIDPFQTIPDEKIAQLNEQIKRYDEEIERLKQLKSFSDSIASKIPQRLTELSAYSQVHDSATSYTRKMDSLGKLKKAAQNQISNQTKNQPNTNTRFALNDSKFILSRRDNIILQKEFDGARHFKPIVANKRELDRVSEIPEDETMFMLLYNVESAVVPDIHETRVDFDDIEHFTQLALKALGEVDVVAQVLPATGNFQEFVKSFVPKNKLFGLRQDTSCGERPLENPIYDQLIDVARQFVQERITLSYKESIFSESEPATANFQTFANQLGSGYKTPFSDTISVTHKQQTVAKQDLVTYFNEGSLSYVRIGAGIAFTSHPVSTTTIDSTGGGFKVTSSDNRAMAIAGFKIYPWQSYNRDRWLRPRYPLRRISLFGGFEILHPLNNFYLGGGYDIVPGLCISVGSNIYLQTNYKIENNAVSDTYRNYKFSGPYYAVLVNPKLFAQFVKSLFK